MKRIFLFIAVVTAFLMFLITQGEAASFNGSFNGAVGTPAAGGVDECEGRLICQNFEGTGYDNSETWGETGTVYEDYTTTVLRGSQSLANASSTVTRSTTPTFAGTDPMYMFFRFRMADISPPSEQTMAQWRNSGTTQGSLILQTSGIPKIYNGTGNKASSGGALSDNTTYYIWIRYAAGSGANGEADLYIGTSSSKPALAATVRNGTSTANIDNVRTQIYDGGASFHAIYDQVLIDDADIGDVQD